MTELTFEECRNFLVSKLNWIPRNYEYEDGMKIMFPELIMAFGDENLNLAMGVLDELIEMNGIPPFPESIYQRWKHQYLHRHVCYSK